MTLDADPLVAAQLSMLESVVPGPPLSAGNVSGTGTFPSAFDVDALLVTAAVAVNLSFGVDHLDRRNLVALCAGRAELDGAPVVGWGDLSGYYRTADEDMIQLHCNFPHHAAGVGAELGCDPDQDAVAAAVRRRNGRDLEAALIVRGMIGARLRTVAEWEQHPHHQATSSLPVITVEQIGDGPPRDRERRLRVLDSSRVLAGPVAGLLFSANGGDVLRIGSARLPSVELGVFTTGAGKRNAFVEFDTAAGRRTMTELLDGSDVWIDAYRPGSLAARGFPPDSAPPGAVIVHLSAFDWVGPWAGRRGYDSIVQSTTGIVKASTEAAGRDQPTPLPVQALDYATGLLAAFAGRRLVEHQAAVGGTWLARLSLLRTRNWLVGLGEPQPFTYQPVTVDPTAMSTFDTPFGQVTTALPISGSWPHGPQPLGSSAPVWLD